MSFSPTIMFEAADPLPPPLVAYFVWIWGSLTRHLGMPVLVHSGRAPCPKSPDFSAMLHLSLVGRIRGVKPLSSLSDLSDLPMTLEAASGLPGEGSLREAWYWEPIVRSTGHPTGYRSPQTTGASSLYTGSDYLLRGRQHIRQYGHVGHTVQSAASRVMDTWDGTFCCAERSLLDVFHRLRGSAVYRGAQSYPYLLLDPAGIIFGSSTIPRDLKREIPGGFYLLSKHGYYKLAPPIGSPQDLSTLPRLLEPHWASC